MFIRIMCGVIAVVMFISSAVSTLWISQMALAMPVRLDILLSTVGSLLIPAIEAGIGIWLIRRAFRRGCPQCGYVYH